MSSAKLSITAPRVLIDGRLTGPTTVVLTGGFITGIGTAPAREGEHIVLEEGILAPGLVDIQINGSFGVDFIAADDDEWARVALALPSTGVTSFQPTYITAPLDVLISGLERAVPVRDKLTGTGAARIIGVHLEGPFLSPARHGVHDPRYLTDPAADAVGALLNGMAAHEILTMVTLAPELPGAIDAIRRFTAAGVRVSIGHTDATADQVSAAADAGATLITHIFNAQRGLAHREPGVPGAAMADPRIACGLIADLHHVAPEVCTLVWRGARGGVVLVTDAIAAAGMPDGAYELSGIPVTLAGGAPRDAAGVLAGSALTLDQAVRNLVGLGLDPAGVLEAASRAPADALGRSDLGRIAVGAVADLVHFTDGLHPRRTWVAGAESFAATASQADLRSAHEPYVVSP